MAREPAQPFRLTRAQVREVDRLSIERFDVPGIVLMENAARGVVDAALEMIDSTTARVAIVCGNGNNGGDGFAAARHLHNRGLHVTVVAAGPPTSGDALVNWRIIDAMRIERVPPEDSEDVLNPHATDLVIDALFGTGLSRRPEGVSATLINLINECGVPTLAIDVPSGLDCDTGEPLGDCVRAARTVTFVAEKLGFANASARQYIGAVTVADIGCPREVVAHVTAPP